MPHHPSIPIVHLSSIFVFNQIQHQKKIQITSSTFRTVPFKSSNQHPQYRNHGSPILRRRQLQDVCPSSKAEHTQKPHTELANNRNGTIDSIKDIVSNLNKATCDTNTEVVIAPPTLYLLLTREHLRKGIEVAAQNVFDKPNGAFTGEISVSQLKDSNITWAVLGHSERRVILQETNQFIASKTKSALDGGIGVILCCGETLEQREAEKTMEVVLAQLKAVADQVKDWSKIVVAYEPVWAIGTGKVATTEQAQEVHKGIREWISKDVSKEAGEQTRIIYGGSVSEKNCRELAKEGDIDGFLVGGASLKPAFVDIINAKKE